MMIPSIVWMSGRVINGTAFDWTIEGIYKKADKYDLYDGGLKDNYEYSRTAYIIDQWSPFVVEVGNVSVNSSSDERQTRFRVV